MPNDQPEEFRRIARHFAPLAGEGGLGLLDDAAVVTPPAGKQVVVAADAMVGGVHFLPDDPADGTARKLLRTNLSDLAAMGADPLGYLLTVSVPRDTPDAWFALFASGLARDQEEFGIRLLGGDTTSTSGPVSLSLTILGTVEPGGAVLRSGARDGDGLWVTGTIGDGILGLDAARGTLDDPSGYLAARYRVPTPRIGLKIGGIAHAAIDVSDGLLQDVGHICRASGVGVEIVASAVPLSPQARAANRLDDCLTGGDDYELAMAVPPERAEALRESARLAMVAVTKIGTFSSGAAHVVVRDDAGAAKTFARRGWSHFA